MGRVYGRFTVYFEEPFWTGVFERIEDGRLSASKVTFGAEPRENEVFEFIQKNFSNLRFSPAVAADVREKKVNPKRMQRQVKKQLSSYGIGTRSQQALKLQQEQNKLERKKKSRHEKLAQAERMFELKQQKRKEKHRGH